MKKERRVVVTGIGTICSLGNNRHQVIKAMKDNKVGISIINQISTDKLLTHIGAEVKQLDEEKYFTPYELSNLDKTARLGIIAIKEAILDSGIEINKKTTGLAFGTCNGGIRSIENYNSIKEIPDNNFLKYTFFGQSDSIVKYFNLTGPVNTINTACTSSGNAIAYASDMIKYGYSDVMIAGGSDAMSLSVYAGFNSLRALNDEPCSPYSVKSGLSLGEGAAFIILEDLKEAKLRKAHIYAEICGYGLSNDGYHATAPDPDGLGIKKSVSMAVNKANIPKEKIGYINTHGTGTLANDAAELKGLKHFFGDYLNSIPISSSKAYFGHTLGAAAALEYTTALLSMQDGLLPATLNFTQARAGCDFKNIIVNQMLSVDAPEYFLTNNSAFGGHNCSIISKLGPYIKDEEEIENSKSKVVIIGAGSVIGSKYTKGSIKKLTNLNEAHCYNEEFLLKEYDKSLYVRRMNKLCQMSVAATDLAINDSEIDISNVSPYDIGMCYGTSIGSMASAEKYLEGIFRKGPENGSSIYFPDMVLNSTPGTVSRLLKIKGYASSISSGGNEGILTLLNAYHVLRDNIQLYCVAAAGDEKSFLANKINRAYGLINSKYKLIEGSTALFLTTYENAIKENVEIYAEILGFGMGTTNNLELVILQAITNSNICPKELDLIFYNTPSIDDDIYSMTDRIYKTLNTKVPIISANENLGYGESISALNQVSLAIGMLHNNKKEDSKAMIISRSLAGHVAILIISK